MDAPALMKKLGFGEYEARAYIALLQHGPGSGYSIARAAGIPRANVYGVLDKLVQRAAAQRYRSKRGMHYSPTPPDTLLDGIDEQHRAVMETAGQALRNLSAARQKTPAFSLDDHDELMARAKSDIAGAEKHLLIAAQPAEATTLADDLERARRRGVHITTLCMQACPQQCGGCQGNVYRLDINNTENERWLMVVADQSSALIAQLSAGSAHGLASAQPLLVELVGAWIRQSLALALIGGDLADRFNGLLSEKSRQILADLHPDENFLARIQALGKTVTMS